MRKTSFEELVMSEEIKVSMFEIVGSSFCVASGDGQKVFERLNTAFEAKRNVVLSFQNVTTLTSAFLNAAIGQLYGKYEEDEIRSLLKVEEAKQDDLALLKRVVDNAKQYFKDPERFKQAYQDVIDDEV